MNLIGKQIFAENPNFLEQYTQPGRHIGSPVDYQKSLGRRLYPEDGSDSSIDETGLWMTEFLDLEKHPELRDRKLKELAWKFTFVDPTPTESATYIQAAFIKMMLDFWPEAKKVLPVSAGGLATDDACWIAACQVGEKVGIHPSKMRGVAIENSFDGRYGRGAKATHSKFKVGHQYDGSEIHCPAPVVEFNQFGENNEQKTQDNFDKSMSSIEKYLAKKDVAYVIVEYPMQAEGGARVMNPQSLQELKKLCDKHGKLLIVDYIQMGGRSWTIKDGFVSPFAEEVLENADIITFGKGFRASGTIVRDFTKLNRGFTDNVYDVHPERWGGTWTAHLGQMLAGWAIMQVILDKKLYNNALIQTQRALQILKEIAKRYPNLISVPRGIEKVAYLGFDSDYRDSLKKIMKEKYHYLVLGARDKTIRWAPNLDVAEKEVLSFMRVIENSLEELSKQVDFIDEY